MIILNLLNTKQLVGKTANHNDGKSFVKGTKIVVSLKYMSNFRRSLEMLLINCRVHLELNWIEDFIFSSTGDSAKLEITDAKLHIPIVTLSTKNRVNLKKQLNECFKRSVYWKSYKTKPAKYKKEKTYTNYLMHISRC